MFSFRYLDTLRALTASRAAIPVSNSTRLILITLER